MADKAADKQEKRKTRYQVFYVRPDDLWEPVEQTDAHSAAAAITEIAAEPGSYRAVPVSNITEQAMGYPPPEQPKLVAVTEAPKVAEPEAADPPHSAAGGSLRVPETVGEAGL